jgi:dimethylaniline monooxygenase (N-oxide forming)
MESIANAAVTFADGNTDEFDEIVFAARLRSAPAVCERGDSRDPGPRRGAFRRGLLHLYPDLPGLAFMGMWDQSGGYFVPPGAQATWIAYTWGGALLATSEAGQRSAIDAYHLRRGMPQKTRMNLVALAFARAAGVAPCLENWPHLRHAPLFEPLAPSCFRIEGPDTLPDAPPGSLAMPPPSVRSRRHCAEPPCRCCCRC